jgi:cell wall-associated NlpC family hydrolase
MFSAALVLLPGAYAYGDPTVPEIEAQINQIWGEAEPLIEKYNEVHEQYQRNQAKQTELQQQIEPLQWQLDLAQARIGVIAAQVYMGGQADTFSAVLTAGSPTVLADQLVLLEQLGRDQHRQLQGVSDIKAQYDAQKAPVDELVAALAKQDADLAAQRKVIEEKLTELQQLRIKAYGTSGSTGSFRPWPCPSEYLPTNGYQAASFACQQAGKPYVWAAAGPSGYDCSGLTLASWLQVGVYLPHNAAAQRRSMPYVSRADLQIGDLVFMYADLHHVAIYVGDNKIMTAPTFGDYVRMVDMDTAGPIHSFGRPG